MKPLRLALYILLFFVSDKSQNPFTLEEVKAVSKDVMISKGLIGSGHQNSV